MSKENKFLEDMGKRIANKRKELGWTQDELAERAGLNSQVVSTAERGTKALRPENLLKISKALAVSSDYLLTGINNDYDIPLDSITQMQGQIITEIVDKCVMLCKKREN